MKEKPDPFSRFIFEDDAIRGLISVLPKVAEEKGVEPLSLIQGNPEGAANSYYSKHSQDLHALEAEGIPCEEGYYTNAYSPTPGTYHYRKVVAEKEAEAQGFMHLKPENIIAVPGAGKGVASIFNALGRRSNQTGKVAVFAPFFPPYLAYIKEAGLEPLIVPMGSEGYQLDNLENIMGDDVKAVMLNSPNNPTGHVYTARFLNNLRGVLEDKGNAVLISDEPYREMMREGQFWTPVFDEVNYVNTMIVNSFSKSMRLAGDRLGYIVVHPYFPTTLPFVGNMAKSLMADGTIQTQTRAQIAMYRTGPTASVDWSTLLNAMDDYCAKLPENEFEFENPKGGMYIAVRAPGKFSGNDFAKALMNQGVGVVPGESFYGGEESKQYLGEGHPFVRLSLSTDDAKKVDEVIARMVLARDDLYKYKG